MLTYASAESTPIPGTLMSSRQAEFDLTNTRIALSKTAICSRTCRQATSIGRTISATSERSKYQSFNLPIERQSPHRAGQKTKCFEHPPDVIGQSRGHPDELSPCAKAEIARRTISLVVIPECIACTRRWTLLHGGFARRVLTSRRLRSCYSSEYRTPELVHPVEGLDGNCNFSRTTGIVA